MARKCASERLLEIAERDLRFRLVSPSARWIWLSLVRLVMSHGTGSVLRFGSQIGSWSEISVGIGVSETELETERENLAQRGLLVLHEDGLALPEWMRDRRAEAARANGAKGGRPPRDPRQKDMMLTIKGGRDRQSGASAETQTEPTEETLSRGRPLLSSEDILEEKEETPAWVSLMPELIRIGKLDPTGRHDPRIVQGWLEAGATAEIIRQAFADVAGRANPPVKPPMTYFAARVHELMTKARPAPAPATAPKDPAMAEAERQLTAIVQRWSNDGHPQPFPPNRADWIAGRTPDRELWLAYVQRGAAVFRHAA